MSTELHAPGSDTVLFVHHPDGDAWTLLGQRADRVVAEVDGVESSTETVLVPLRIEFVDPTLRDLLSVRSVSNRRVSVRPVVVPSAAIAGPTT